MASSRKSKRRKSASPDLAAHVAARLKRVVRPRERLVLGLSGGVDSIVLLDVLARLRKRLGFELAALHVNHQLSPNAARWATFCRAACRGRGVACRVVKVEIARGDSVERAAREARYAAFRSCAADHVALAHNADDQAETVLLQLLRGGGVKGLAAMAALRKERRKRGEEKATSIVRPLLDIPRADIELHAKRRELEWVEDESNADTGYMRNWARHALVPLIAQRVPGYRSVLGRAARHFGEASELLDALGRIDVGDAGDVGAAVPGATVEIARLRSLSPARAKNALRFLIGAQGWRMPDADRLEEGLRQALSARRDARLAVSLGSCVLRRQGGMLHLVAPRGSAAGATITWQGEREIAVPGLDGVLTMTPRRGAGMSVAQLQAQPITIRHRQGGERLQPDAGRPRRTAKNLLQEARIPAWERERLPFIYCGETLACIPGIAVDHRFQARRGEPSILALWRPQGACPKLVEGRA